MTDNTQDILERYGSNINSGIDSYSPNIDKEDDISLYSEGSIFQEQENLSPTKKGSPLKNSIFTPRKPATMNKGYSPAKARLEATSGRRANMSDISMDKNIRDFISTTVVDLETDKTDLLIRETHSLINEVPSSIMATKDGEEYQKTVSAMMNKLIRKCETMSAENERLKSHNHEGLIDQLKNRIEALTRSNELHKYDMKQQNEDFLATLNENHSLKHENELLRTKLIKYKSLYESKQTSPDGPNEQRSRPNSARSAAKEAAPKKSEKMSQLIHLYNQMAEILNKEKKSNKVIYTEEPEEPEPEPENGSNLLKQFEQIISNQNPPKRPDDEYKQLLSTNNKLYEKLLQVFEEKTTQTNQQPIHQGPQPHSGQEASQKEVNSQAKEVSSQAGNSQTKEPNSQDIILQCYICSEELHKHKPSHPTQPKRTCERCSTVSSKANMADFNHTLDLMGEYKWTL